MPIKRLLISLLLIITTSFSYAQRKEQKKVKACFENYKDCILNDKGEEAVNYVDSRTIKYYTEMLEFIKNGDSTTVDSLGILDKILIFSIRHRTSNKKILDFDGKGLFVYAINEGMVGKNSVANNSVGEVIIEGNFAKGQFISRGQKYPIYFHFYKEEEKWKLDLTSIIKLGSGAFVQMQMESGMSQNEYLFYLLELLTGRKPGNEIWDKVNS